MNGKQKTEKEERSLNQDLKAKFQQLPLCNPTAIKELHKPVEEVVSAQLYFIDQEILDEVEEQEEK